MFKKRGKLKKAFTDFEAQLTNHCLVEKKWEEFKQEIVTELQIQMEERTCDNFQIFDINDGSEYDIHIVVADSVFNMYALYVKVLRQTNEAETS